MDPKYTSKVSEHFKLRNLLALKRAYISTKKRFWSRGLVKSRQKNWRESRSRETEVGEKIAVTTGEAVGVLAFDFSAAFDCIAYTLSLIHI